MKYWRNNSSSPVFAVIKFVKFRSPRNPKSSKSGRSIYFPHSVHAFKVLNEMQRRSRQSWHQWELLGVFFFFIVTTSLGWSSVTNFSFRKRLLNAVYTDSNALNKCVQSCSRTFKWGSGESSVEVRSDTGHVFPTLSPSWNSSLRIWLGV